MTLEDKNSNQMIIDWKNQKKVKNLVYLNEPGDYSNYNYPKQKNKFSELVQILIKINKNEKPISVNSNNSYLISKLKKMKV